MVLSRSIDGFTAGTPLPVLQDDRNAILAIGMNGEPLPEEHGFPVRMVVPGLYGYVSATKWVVELRGHPLRSRTSAYWTDRGWGERGPIKIESRIDVAKRDGDELLVAGVAWHQHTGISRVEVQVDDGPWAEAELADAISIDTWVQWSYRGDADRRRPHRAGARDRRRRRDADRGRRGRAARRRDRVSHDRRVALAASSSRRSRAACRRGRSS